MEERIFSLRYDGAGISEGLEPAAFSEALRGFTEFITTITEHQYGDAGQTTLKVHRLSQGSLVLDVLQRLGDLTLNDMIAATASVSTEIRQAIDLLKHLRGQPPKSQERVSDNRVAVQNNSGNIAVFNNSTVNLVVNGDIGGSIERFAKPVQSGEASGFSLALDAEAVAQVSRSEAGSMVSVAQDKALLESESELWLTATKVVLEGEANWTFSDGRRPFSAPVNDPDFLAGVNTGRERFGNGDRLLVRLKARQTQRGSKLRTQYEVVKVIRHERSSVAAQGDLLQ